VIVNSFRARARKHHLILLKIKKYDTTYLLWCTRELGVWVWSAWHVGVECVASRDEVLFVCLSC